MRSHCALLRHLGIGALTALALAEPRVASAQTWSAPRNRPSVWQLVTTDATGESAWPFGVEDVAGDGASFALAERSVDVRSAYATTDDARLWVRAYVSSTAAPDPSLRLYVFVDTDGDRSTGGSAAASTIEPAFTADPTAGGYEHVLGLAGDGTVIGVWDYRAAQGTFEPNPPGTGRARAEAGADVDPLRFRDRVRGYVGGSVDLRDVPLAASCNGAALFFRAVSDVGDDLDVGPRAECVASDGNGNRIPDRVEDVRRCDADDDCPAGGRCIDGACRYAPACAESADCGAGQACEDDRCVVTGGENCDSNTDCNGLVCASGACTPCTESGITCAAGQACAPDGRCVPGSAGPEKDSESLVDPDERVQGGAFTCGVGRWPSHASSLGFALSWLLLWRRRARRER